MHWFFKLVLFLIPPLFFWVVFALVLPKVLPTEYRSNTEVSGWLIRNQVWEGTIRISGDLITSQATTITLKPGTIVLVSSGNDNFNFDLLPWHLKEGINTSIENHGVKPGEPFWDEADKVQLHIGRIIALGTKEQPIIIKSDTSMGSPYDVNVINIKSGILSNVNLSNYRRLEIGDKITIRDSGFRDIGECAVCISRGSPVILNNKFEKILREAVWVQGASPQIKNNLFINLSGAGIRVDPQRFGDLAILNNSFEMPNQVALDILGGDEEDPGTIALNLFSGNSLIKMPCDSKIRFIQNNMGGLISFYKGGCSGSYIFGGNYWGGADAKTVLAEKIMNKEKGFSITIPFILREPVKNAGRKDD